MEQPNLTTKHMKGTKSDSLFFFVLFVCFVVKKHV